MTDKIELKPCPFCGGDAQMEPVKLRSGTWYGVVCRNTGNLGGTCAIEQVPSRTPEAAAGRWNMRQVIVTESEHQQGQSDQLKEEVEALAHWRDLALQFDNHRMAALWHLKRLVVDPQSRSCAELFLSEPPLAAHEVVAERDQLKADSERLARNRDMWKGQVERQAEELTRLRKALTECADSLHAEMLQKFGGQLPDDMHPVTRREYDRDMVEVAGYRAATAEADEDIPDFTPGNGNTARRRAEALGLDYDAALGKGEQP